MAFTVTVAASHFLHGEFSNQYKQNVFPHLQEGAKDMLKRVSVANQDAPMYPVSPQYVINTDDTTTYIFEGVTDNECTWRLSILTICDFEV